MIAEIDRMVYDLQRIASEAGHSRTERRQMRLAIFCLKRAQHYLMLVFGENA